MATRTASIRRVLSLAGLSAVLTLATAWSLTTAHISGFRVGKDEDVTKEISTFGPMDTIYAVCEVSNVPSKVTLKIQTIAEKVDGIEDNFHVVPFDKSYDLDKDSTATYSLSKPTAGWRAGTYRLEARMYSDGAEKSKKIVAFKVVVPAAS